MVEYSSTSVTFYAEVEAYSLSFWWNIIYFFDKVNETECQTQNPKSEQLPWLQSSIEKVESNARIKCPRLMLIVLKPLK